jgi:ubiquinone biosynthesis protein UbiJ
MDENELRYEIRSLEIDLRRAYTRIAELETQLRNEEDRHHRTKHERDEYKGRCDRSYDAYVTDPHEGYIPQSDVDELYEDIAHLTDENAALKAQLEAMENES